MPLFCQIGHILHFFRSFSIFRQGSCLISLYPIFSPSFPELSLSFSSLSPLFNPRFINFVRYSRVFATPPFPNTRKRCIPTICCNRQLEYSQPGSSTGALQKLYACSTAAPSCICHASLQLPCNPVSNLSSPYLPPEGNTAYSTM